jgi:S-DNA-T family DNA segregation ATPase FtsK/SpoIIIE
VLGRHFWQDEAGERFLDFERKQAHGVRFARLGAVSKPGLIRKSLFSGSENNLAPGQESGNAVAAAKLMAAKDNKKRGETPEPTRWSNEITGIIWITAGLLLFLSLVKYSPADLPKWGPLEAMAGKSAAAGENLIGPVGGILGFVQILLFGAAGYLLPVGFIWFGVIKLAFDARIWPRAVLGFSILLLAGAAWLDTADFFFKEWARTCNLSGPGGVIGDGLGGFVLTNVIGKAGTLILTSGAYLVALIMLTGQQPVRFAKACCRLARLKFHEWQASRSATGKIAAREAEMLAERERQREQRRQDREAAKSATSAKAAAEDPQAC